MSTTGNRWPRILSRVEAKLEEIAAQGDDDRKIVTMPAGLDALAKEIRECMNAIVHTEAEHAKLCTQLEQKQRRMVDQMRALGIKAQVIEIGPESPNAE